MAGCPKKEDSTRSPKNATFIHPPPQKGTTRCTTGCWRNCPSSLFPFSSVRVGFAIGVSTRLSGNVVDTGMKVATNYY
jgi:hypothetical protein